MFKVFGGKYQNPETGETKELLIPIFTKDNVKDLLIGGSIILTGLSYIFVKSFINGTRAFDMGELKVYEYLGLLKDSDDVSNN